VTVYSLDEALIRLAGTGPEFGAGLSNHGPMACEALTRLGRGDAIGSWLDRYRPQLEEAPERGRPLGPDEWRGALGSSRRYPDWLALFEGLLAGSPWAEVVATWGPRLLPGVMAAATHGPIRTAHAARALSVADTGPRRHELAAGLAYWASTYQPLPGTPVPSGLLAVNQALEQIPVLPADARAEGPIYKQVAKVDEVAGFAQAVDALAAPISVDDALSELTQAMAGWYLANREHDPIAFVHGVTAPAALRLLLPYLPASDHPAAFAYLWQACAALRSACAVEGPHQLTPDGVADPEVLADQAVEIGGAHAIKLTEACLREHAHNPRPVYLHAAADVSRRLSI
jgi:hypothetical protein